MLSLIPQIVHFRIGGGRGFYISSHKSIILDLEEGGIRLIFPPQISFLLLWGEGVNQKI